MPRLTRRRAVLLALAVPLGLLALYDLATMTKGVGATRFNVRVVSRVPVREVRYESFASREWAEEASSYKSVDRRDAVPPPECEGDRFIAWVKTTDSESGLRLRTSYHQFRYLLVVATLADDRRVEKLVELPDFRESREVTVALD